MFVILLKMQHDGVAVFGSCETQPAAYEALRQIGFEEEEGVGHNEWKRVTGNSVQFASVAGVLPITAMHFHE